MGDATRSDETGSIKSDTGHWTVVPEWVLDLPISDRAVRLYAVLGAYADYVSADAPTAPNARPSRRTLAARLRCSVDSVDRALRELEEHRTVLVVRYPPVAGASPTNDVTVIRANPHLPAPTRLEGRTDAAHLRRTHAEGEGRTDAAQPRASDTESPSTEEPTLSLVGTDAATVDPFDEFWKVYPNKRGKPAARRAFTAATKRAPAETIIAGARRYAADPNRLDSFTKWPQGWLSEDRWDDPPLPSRTGGPSPNAGIDTDRGGPTGLVDWRTS